MRIGAVGVAFLRRCDRPRRSIEGDKEPWVRLNEHKPAGHRLALPREGVLPRGIEHDNAGLHWQLRKSPRQVRDSDRLDRHICRRRELGVDWHEVVLALELKAVAGEIHHCDTIGPSRPRLVHKIAERPAQRVPVEVPGSGDVKTRSLQLLRDQPCVVGRRRQFGALIGRIANNQRDPPLLRLLRCRRPCQKKYHQPREQSKQDDVFGGNHVCSGLFGVRLRKATIEQLQRKVVPIES